MKKQLLIILFVSLVCNGCGKPSEEEIGKIAKEITVTIDGCSAGSGVIFEKDGDEYSVLSAYHVFDSSDDENSRNDDICYVITSDGKKRTIKRGSAAQPLPDIDLAVFTFKDDTNTSYPVAKLGNSDQIGALKTVYVAGVPGDINKRSLLTSSGKILSIRPPESVTDGYALAYDNVTKPGMSGGPVLDEFGQLVGIHGQGDRESETGGKTGVNYGIPINKFLEYQKEQKANLNPDAPKNAKFYLYEGHALAGKGDLPGAIESYTKAIDLKPDNAIAYYKRAKINDKLNNIEAAMADFDKAIELKDDLADAYYDRGYLKLDLKQQKEAIKDFSKAIEINVKNGQNDKNDKPYNNRGIAYFDIDDKSSAIADFTKAIELNQNYYNAYYNRGYSYYELKEKDKAMSDFNQAIRTDSSSNKYEAYFDRGRIYYERQQHQKAFDDFNEAIALKSYPEAWYYRGLVSYELNDIKGALEDLNQAHQRGIKKAQLYYIRGLCSYSITKDPTDAIADLDRAINIDSSYADQRNDEYAKAYYDRGEKRHKNKNLEGAVEDFTKAIELNPDYAKAYNYRGWVNYDLGEKKQAVQDYSKAIELDPKYGNAYYNRGEAYYDLEQLEEALSDLDQAIKINPKKQVAYYYRGRVYYDQKDHSKAIENFDRAIKLKPEDAESWYYRGLSKYDLDEKKDAIKDFNQAQSLGIDQKEEAKLYYYRGLAKYDLKDYKEAVDDLNQAKKLGIDEAKLYYHRGLASYNVWDKPEDAIADFKRAINRDSDYEKNPDTQYPEAYYKRGIKRHESGDKDAAIDDLDRAIELNPDYAKAYNYRGLVYDSLNQTKQAIEDYSKAIEINSKYANAYNNRAKAYQELGNTLEAKQDFEKAADLFKQEGKQDSYKKAQEMIKKLERTNSKSKPSPTKKEVPLPTL